MLSGVQAGMAEFAWVLQWVRIINVPPFAMERTSQRTLIRAGAKFCSRLLFRFKRKL